MGTSARTAAARRLFEGLAPSYEMPAALFGLGQYGRWRRAAVRRLAPAPGARVLDVATGTGLVAREILRRNPVRVAGIDLTPAMLERARGRRIPVAAAQAERLPFPDACFEAVAFSYLLRYLDDPPATLREMARVLRPGGQMISIEFGVPARVLPRALWRLYALRAFPLAARLVSRGWRDAAVFLGPSIAEFCAAAPPEAVARWWMEVGMRDVSVRRLSFGAGVLTWGWRA